MAIIQFPPDGLDRHNDFEQCVAFDDDLEIVFNHTTFISPQAVGFFTPDIPTAMFLAGTNTGQLSPFPKNTEVKVDFIDLATFKFYVCTVKIRPSCK
jgi:hypothetical protein